MRNAWSRIALLVLVGFLLPRMALSGIGPENVAVVVNGDSPGSLRVANEYARLRQIPPTNFVVLHGLGQVEYIDVDHFRDLILKPTLDALKERGLTGQIDCITYSTDVPYSVSLGRDMQGKRFPQIITQPASINGLTYLSEWVLKEDVDYLRLDINKYARHTLPLAPGADLTQAEQADYAAAISEYDQKHYKTAIEGLTKLLKTTRSDPNVAYNLACCHALSGQPEEAVHALRMAVGAGWRNYGQTTSDPDLASLANRDDFKRVLHLIKGARIQIQPGVPFRHAVAWDRSGSPGQTGAHYMLSTVLGVTAGRGNSNDEVLYYLRRSKAADFTAPKGTVYFERNGDVRSKTREWGFQPAADELKSLGVNAIIEDGILPQGRTDIAGAMIGTAGFDWKASHSTVLPGAILEHLTSFGGMLNEGAGQTPCTDFLRWGASGSSGTVTEPYALQEKFPTPFIHVQYAKGFTLAESFYLSVSGPYQLLILGDPLCRPWAKKVAVHVAGIQQGSELTGTLTLRPSVAPTLPVAAYHLYVDGKWRRDARPGSTLSVSKAIGEGYHRLTVVAELAGPTAARYGASYDIRVPGCSVEAPMQIEARLDGNVPIQVTAKGAVSIELFHLGSSLGVMKGDHALFAIPAATIGQGITTLYPVATYLTNGKLTHVNGPPIRVILTRGG